MHASGDFHMNAIAECNRCYQRLEGLSHSTFSYYNLTCLLGMVFRLNKKKKTEKQKEKKKKKSGKTGIQIDCSTSYITCTYFEKHPLSNAPHVKA